MDEAQVVGDVILVARQDATKVLQPSKQSLDLPATLVTSKRATVLRGRSSAVAFMRGDQFNTLGSELGVELVTVVGAIPDQSGRGRGDKPAADSVWCKGDFMWRSRCNVYGDRKTMAVCHRHELRTFAPLGLSHTEPPFFATTKVPSIKHSDRSSEPRLRKSSANTSSSALNAPHFTHSWKRRWQVWYGGNRPGRSAHGAPVRRIQNTPLSTTRSSSRGRPRPSLRRGFASSGSIKLHCSSVSCSARLISCYFGKNDLPKLTEVLVRKQHYF